MKINFVGGSGKMGGVLIPILRKGGHRVVVTGRTSKITPEQGAWRSDMTIVCVPIPNTMKTIRQVAPFAPAIGDLTSVKYLPTEAMLRYSQKGAEVAGYHPSFGEVESIDGRTIFNCPTYRSGERCREFAQTLEDAGARIAEITPEQHDIEVSAIGQILRTFMFESFGRVLRKRGVDFEEFYWNCPPPTRKVLDLLARQVNVSNDVLYQSMPKYNPFAEEVIEDYKSTFKGVARRGLRPQRTRKMFGSRLLEIAQENSVKMISLDVRYP